MFSGYKILKLFFKISLASILIALILLIATLLYVRQDPAALSHYIAEKIVASTNMSCQFSKVEILILPLPALKISDIQLHNAQLGMSAKYIKILPSVSALLNGKLEPRFILLSDPKIKAHTNQNTFFYNNIQDSKNTLNLSALKQIFLEKLLNLEKYSLTIQNKLKNLDDFNIKIINGNFHLSNNAEETLQINKIHVNIAVNKPSSIDGQISAEIVRLSHKKQKLIKLEDVNINIADHIFALQQNLPSYVEIQSKISIPNLLNLTKFDLNFEKIEGKKIALVQSEYEFSGTLFWHEKPIPIALSGEIEELTHGHFTLNDGIISLDKDKLTINATINIPSFTSDNTKKTKEVFSIEGNINAEKLNLVQWFDFARILPAGLQHSVNNLNGLVDFNLNSSGLKISKIVVNSTHIKVTGKGAITRWSNPLVYLNFHAKNIDVPKVFPESVGIFTNNLSFTHQALIPILTSKKAQYTFIPKVDYDIRFSFDSVNYAFLKAGKSSLRCVPTKDGNIDLIININNLYKGNAKANIEISSLAHSASRQIEVKAQLHNISTKKPSHALKIKQKIEGTLFGNFDFKAKADSINSFLSSVSGTGKIIIDNAHITNPSSDKEGVFFDKLQLLTKINNDTKSIQIHKNTIKHKVLTFNSTHLLNLQNDLGYTSLEIVGPISIGFGKNFTLSFHELPLKLDMTLDKSIISAKRNLNSQLTGIFSYNSANTMLTSKKYKLIIEKNEITGNIQSNLHGDNFHLKSSVSLKSKDFKNILSLWFDAKSIPQSTFKDTYISTQLSLDSKSLSLNNISASFDKINVNGFIKRIFQNIPLWEFKLNTSNFNIDNYYNKNTDKKSNNDKPLDFSLLKKIEANGTLTFNNSTFQRIKFDTLTIPIKYANAILECSPINAKLYNSYASGIFRLIIKEKSTIQASIKATHLDMLPLTKDQNYNVLMGGRGSFDIIVQGNFINTTNILNHLSADLRFNIINGFLQDKPKKGSNQSRSNFNSILSTVTLSKGILYNNDFKMLTNNTSMTGKGWINLDSQKIDYTIYAKLPLLGTIPVHYHGNLDNPKRDIQSSGGITSIISSAGSLLFTQINNLFSAIFGLLAL